MKKTKWGQTILELQDVANLPLVSKNAEIVEKKVEELIANVQSGQLESIEDINIEINNIKTLIHELETTQTEKYDSLTTEIDNLKTKKADKDNVVTSVNGKKGDVVLEQYDNDIEELFDTKLDKHMKDEKNKQTYTIVFKNGELYKREVL